MTNLPLADRFLAIKATFDAAEAALKAIKAEVDATGSSHLEGIDCDLAVHLSQRPQISEKLLMEKFGITKEQLATCKVEGAPFPVIKIKTKMQKAA
jgi:hypothetical protein